MSDPQNRQRDHFRQAEPSHPPAVASHITHNDIEVLPEAHRTLSSCTSYTHTFVHGPRDFALAVSAAWNSLLWIFARLLCSFIQVSTRVLLPQRGPPWTYDLKQNPTAPLLPFSLPCFTFPESTFNIVYIYIMALYPIFTCLFVHDL